AAGAAALGALAGPALRRLAGAEASDGEAACSVASPAVVVVVGADSGAGAGAAHGPAGGSTPAGCAAEPHAVVVAVAG
ncbi:hypothetical protein, partial [Blastococcus sp. CCUG 61487]|uniref:hypothetical protein n=1 Tax=Blastococcus sp. CCUG 61487 TaxID=1840703 RepID=UPI001BB0A8EE